MCGHKCASRIYFNPSVILHKNQANENQLLFFSRTVFERAQAIAVGFCKTTQEQIQPRKSAVGSFSFTLPPMNRFRYVCMCRFEKTTTAVDDLMILRSKVHIFLQEGFEKLQTFFTSTMLFVTTNRLLINIQHRIRATINIDFRCIFMPNNFLCNVTFLNIQIIKWMTMR